MDKTSMTDEEKLECMITHLIEDHLDYFGGYPYDYEWIGKTLIVASLDDRKERHRTQIDKYTRRGLLGWYRRAAKFADETGESMNSAVWETQR